MVVWRGMFDESDSSDDSDDSCSEIDPTGMESSDLESESEIQDEE